MIADTRKMAEYIRNQGQAEKKELLGKGVSLMRRAYLQGIKECLSDFASVSPTRSLPRPHVPN